MNPFHKDPADEHVRNGAGEAVIHEASDRISALRDEASQALTKAKDGASQIARDLKARASTVAGDVSARASEMAHKVKDETTLRLHEADEWTKNHRLASAAVTLGIGAVIGAALYAILKPEPTPRQHAREIMRGLRNTLADLGEQGSDRASHFADDSRRAFRRGAHAVADTRTRFVDQLRSIFG